MFKIYHKYTRGNSSQKLVIYFDNILNEYLFHYMVFKRTNPSPHLKSLGHKPKRELLSELKLTFKTLSNINFNQYPFYFLMDDFEKYGMKTLADYQKQLLDTKNQEIKSLGYDDKFLLDASDLDVSDLFDLWLIDHPRPDVVDHNDTQQALACALWMLERDDFVSYASGDGVCEPAYTHKNRILKAIEQKDPAHTAWFAAYQYVEARSGELVSVGQDQEG